MASDSPRSPRNLRGALVVFGASVPIPTNLIVFQYNPDTMSRSFRAAAPPADDAQRNRSGDTAGTLPPVESYTLSVDPALAALELLLYPDSTAVILNKVLAAAGMSLITPPRVPVVLLVWGLPRVVPVRVTSVAVTEQAYDEKLNPIRAKVDLGLQALTEAELRQAGAPFDTLGVVNLIAKEVLSKTNVISGGLEIEASLSF